MNPINADEQDARDMSRLAAGHDAALNDLMERHGRKLFHYLLRLLESQEDAADLAQETFVRVFQNRARFKDGQRFTPWLYTIAANLVRDRYRWRSRHPQVSMDHASGAGEVSLKSTLPSADPLPDCQMQSAEQARLVRQAVAALPEELRQPLILAVYQELSRAEIAGILQCSVKAVETRIYRARRELRERLAGLVGPSVQSEETPKGH